MPLVCFNLTCQPKLFFIIVCRLKSKLIGIIFPLFLVSCGATSWYSIQQTPAEPVAYLRDGVVMSGDYIRGATISEVDENAVMVRENGLILVPVGTHKLKIMCEEAYGKFNSNEFVGKARVLELDAKTQRTYKVYCKPYTHWWIEDIENGDVVAGEEFI
jgi:hypothetical protein